MAALLAPVCAAAPREDDLASLRAQFQQQTDAIKRAKLFPKLGTALLAEMKRQEAAKQYERVPPLLIEYRDSAASAVSALSAGGRDAEKHASGFRELEMHLRHALHQVNDIVYGMPLEDREPLLGPQHDIEDLDNKLVKALFPRGPQPQGAPPSKGNPHPQG
jgi:hypothetical protein